MTFEEFKTNVETWAAERGIYEHSTPLAQALKAVSEVGELADATIKGDIDGIKDAIGDVAVCLINVAAMTETDIDIGLIFDSREEADSPLEGVAIVSDVVGDVAFSAAYNIPDGDSDNINLAFFTLNLAAQYNNIDFMDCCESAWNEIKDRKGYMVAGGAFVKETFK